MPLQKRKSNALSDDFVVSDDDADYEYSNKNNSSPRSKKDALPPSKRSKPSNSSSQPQVNTDAEGNTYWEISKSRRIVVSEFKGKKMVSIREYYQKDGKDLPGKKGITMTVEQYAVLLGLVPAIGEVLNEMGEEVPRVKYLGETVKEEKGDEGGTEGAKMKKSNHEATSDEDEDDG